MRLEPCHPDDHSPSRSGSSRAAIQASRVSAPTDPGGADSSTRATVEAPASGNDPEDLDLGRKSGHRTQGVLQPGVTRWLRSGRKQ